MRADQIVTKKVITVMPKTSIEDAAKIMLETHISGLTVLNEAGKIVGIVTECARETFSHLACWLKMKSTMWMNAS